MCSLETNVLIWLQIYLDFVLYWNSIYRLQSKDCTLEAINTSGLTRETFPLPPKGFFSSAVTVKGTEEMQSSPPHLHTRSNSGPTSNQWRLLLQTSFKQPRLWYPQRPWHMQAFSLKRRSRIPLIRLTPAGVLLLSDQRSDLFYIPSLEAEVSPMQLILTLLIRLFHITFDNINNCPNFCHGSFTCNRRESQDHGKQKYVKKCINVINPNMRTTIFGNWRRVLEFV